MRAQSFQEMDSLHYLVVEDGLLIKNYYEPTRKPCGIFR